MRFLALATVLALALAAAIARLRRDALVWEEDAYVPMAAWLPPDDAFVEATIRYAGG